MRRSGFKRGLHWPLRRQSKRFSFLGYGLNFSLKEKKISSKKKVWQSWASCLKDFVPKFLTEKEIKSASFEEFL